MLPKLYLGSTYPNYNIWCQYCSVLYGVTISLPPYRHIITIVYNFLNLCVLLELKLLLHLPPILIEKIDELDERGNITDVLIGCGGGGGLQIE